MSGAWTWEVRRRRKEGILPPLTHLPCPTARVTQLVRGFAATWKASVETLSQDVMRSFTNFKNGTTIIQVGGRGHLVGGRRGPEGAGPSFTLIARCRPQGALTQLIQYYHRFHKVLALPPLKGLAVRSELINIHHLMVEVKKHRPNF